MMSPQEVQVEIDRKEALKKGLENMISLVRDPSAKSNLSSQLSLINKEINELKSSVDGLNAVSFNDDKSEILQGKETSLVSVPKHAIQKKNYTEFKGHFFRTNTEANSSTCYNCHDVLFGNSQTLECKGRFFHSYFQIIRIL
jgi:hypothetical protein